MEKLNKRGFTLVEVLGVIVILSILVLLISAGIMGYFNKGKDDYNDKLKDQLVLAGKSYFSDHNNELPVINGKAYSYITLPEIQSNNYIAKSFVDSEGRECSPSYVYVKEKSYNSKDYEYIPCLICQDNYGNQITYSNSEYCKISNWDDNKAPTCTYKRILKYSDSDFYIEDAKDMIDETKQGNISAIIIKNVTQKESKEIIITKGKQVGSINIKQAVKKLFPGTSGDTFEVKVADDSHNLSDNNCMTFTSCIELDNKTYTRGTTLPGGYAGGKWTVVSDNGDSVSLAYNGVSGSGGYNNAKNYLTNNFVNPNKILKDSMNYGCLVDQGSNTYVSTDAKISDGYTSSNYWTGADQWYNSETKNHLTLKSTSYVAGIAFNEELKRYQANTNEPNVTAITERGIRNTSSNNYDVNRDTGIVTFKNTNSSQYNFTGGGYSNYWSKYSMIHIEGTAITIGSESCTASKNNLCGANYRYQWIDGFGWSLLDQTLPTKNNTTDTIWFIPCGGPDHGKEFYIQSYSDSQYYYSLLGEYLNYSDGYQIIHASMDSTHCNSSEYGYVNCTGNAGGPYTRYYKLYEDYCSTQKEYKLTNTTAQLNYRPYIIVSKNKY